MARVVHKETITWYECVLLEFISLYFYDLKLYDVIMENSTNSQEENSIRPTRFRVCIIPSIV